MSIVTEFIRVEASGNISFGDYTLEKKAKLDDFLHDGDVYKVKTYAEMTKLEKNGLFLYDSVPGTSVNEFAMDDRVTSCYVEGAEDAQLTFDLEADSSYDVYVDGEFRGEVSTGVSGKLVCSVELGPAKRTELRIVKK